MEMELGVRTQVSAQEAKLLKILELPNRLAFRRKQRRQPGFSLNVRQMLRIAGMDETQVPPVVKMLLDRTVVSVSRAGSRFIRGSVCVQFHEDSDDVMRWAFDQGALLCITRAQIDDLPCIVVQDPVEVYSAVCHYFRTLSQVEATAVVGSIGKTTTKRMLTAVYAAQYNTYADPENENQIDCVGYICHHIPKKAERLVQEVSEDTPGCLRLISQMLEPKLAVVTAVDKAHIEAFGSEEKILEEIASVTQGMPEDGQVIINLDDENTRNLIKDRKVVTISCKDRDADYYAEDISLQEDGLSFSVRVKETGRCYPVKLKTVYAKHNVYAALSAFAAGVCTGVDIKNIIKGIAAYRTVGIRQNVYRAGKTLLYVDCYNAVARSVHSAITAAAEIPVKNQRVAVLGDVEEAGEFSDDIHREIVEAVNGSNFSVVLFYGPKMIKAASEVTTRESLQVICCETREKLNATVKKYAAAGNLILFKASRKSRLEEAIAATWPIVYRKKMLSYYWAIIKWRIKTICS